MRQFDLESEHFVMAVTVSPDGSGMISSNLHEEQAGADEEDGHAEWEAGIDAIESLVLAHACAGINISSPEYIKGIETAVQALGNNL